MITTTNILSLVLATALLIASGGFVNASDDKPGARHRARALSMTSGGSNSYSGGSNSYSGANIYSGDVLSVVRGEVEGSDLGVCSPFMLVSTSRQEVEGTSGKAGKGGKGKGSRRLSSSSSCGKGKGSGDSGCDKNEDLRQDISFSTGIVDLSMCDTKKCSCEKPSFVEARQEDECIDSHVGSSTYEPLSGWRYKVTEQGLLYCDGIFDVGWEKDGKFDSLIIMRNGAILGEWGTCPTDFQVEEGDYLIFYSDNSHEYAGFTLCLSTASRDGGGLMPAPPADDILTDDGCVLSHPEFNGVDRYYRYSGYSFQIGRDGCMTAEAFNVRNEFSTLTLKTSESEEITKYTGENGPKNQPIKAGEIITWKVDDAFIADENIGYKICFSDTCG
eukprot:CAMPEP_0178630156 /NCGR_PEP_ID=MMETSP0698-20121128/10341_1 /TAXON_ID=265572 /ORGANISM="Extubocellulus spinifer, Strain CCMP396" /LENGTH=387 /DNA_ID=CAMNT_0020269527 /DNA_START=53 /DNA_END=1216 /DNA_ORIENTATION=-